MGQERRSPIYCDPIFIFLVGLFIVILVDVPYIGFFLGVIVAVSIFIVRRMKLRKEGTEKRGEAKEEGETLDSVRSKLIHFSYLTSKTGSVFSQKFSADYVKEQRVFRELLEETKKLEGYQDLYTQFALSFEIMTDAVKEGFSVTDVVEEKIIETMRVMHQKLKERRDLLSGEEDENLRRKIKAIEEGLNNNLKRLNQLGNEGVKGIGGEGLVKTAEQMINEGIEELKRIGRS